MSCIIVTNNPKAKAQYENWCPVYFLDSDDCVGVLTEARDLIHRGYVLLSHPMAGSMKPNQSPYRSILMREPGKGNGGSLDLESLDLIENGIAAAVKFLNTKQLPPWPQRIRQDFQTVDLSILGSAVERMKQFA